MTAVRGENVSTYHWLRDRDRRHGFGAMERLPVAEMSRCEIKGEPFATLNRSWPVEVEGPNDSDRTAQAQRRTRTQRHKQRTTSRRCGRACERSERIAQRRP